MVPAPGMRHPMCPDGDLVGPIRMAFERHAEFTTRGRPRPNNRRSAACAQRDSRRSWDATYGRARRWPPRSAILSSRDVNWRTSRSRSGAHPKPSHSSAHSLGVRWPRLALHRRHAATSFSTQLGPPLIRGTTCSVVASTNPTPTVRPHHTHVAPSRARITSMRARRSSRLPDAVGDVVRTGLRRPFRERRRWRGMDDMTTMQT